MADTPQIHPLRQRMIEDMTLRGINSASQKTYLRAVRACCTHAGRKPGELTAEDARAFLLHLQRRGLSVGSINSHASGLRRRRD
jgi:integrase/recombinase XerD